MPFGCAKDVLLLETEDLKNMDQCYTLYLKIWIMLLTDLKMITSETPYKLAEIIRDTWPILYRPPSKTYNNQKNSKNEKVQQ